MVPKQYGQATIHIVPDLRGFKFSLLCQVVEADIVGGWLRLEKVIRLRYYAQQAFMSRALYEAERAVLTL